MLALAGLPATVGFIGKLYLIEALVEGDYTWLAVFIAVGTMISLAYYLRVVAAMWMRPGARCPPARPRRSPAPRPRPTRSTPRPAAAYLVGPALLAAAATVFFGIIPQPLVEFAERAGASLFSCATLAPDCAAADSARWASSSLPLAIVVATAVGVWSERRWPLGAANAAPQSAADPLYALLPPVIFFNLAKATSTSTRGRDRPGTGRRLARPASSPGSIASRVLRLPRHQVGAVIVCRARANTGYLGYPLTVALLGHDRLSTAVLYDVLVTGPSLLLGAFAVGAAFGNQGRREPRDRVRAFFTRNPPLYAAIAGLLAPGALAPNFLVDASQALVVAILPIGFFAVGATLAEGAEHGELPLPPPLTRPVLSPWSARLALARPS